MDFTNKLNRYVLKVEAGLDRYLPSDRIRPARLHAAMRYSIEAGGKRLRPVLVLAAAALGDARRRADPMPAAVALECIHTYSLIHDDLPCMDNDDLRRGRPTAHKAFDEATALLAGDALLTHAFALIATAYASRPRLATALSGVLGDAAGSRHLVGGQMADLLAEKKADATASELRFIHCNKTAALIEASLVMGGHCGGLRPAHLGCLRKAGQNLGLAFQIVDDILDVTADSATLGKTVGKDARAEKTTYVKLHGLAAARRMAHRYSKTAAAAFERLPGDSDFLADLARSLETRIK